MFSFGIGLVQEPMATAALQPSPDTRIPALTTQQRKKIITIDLDNPPPFVRVMRSLNDAREITHDVTDKSLWLYRPNWGIADGLFDRGEQSLFRNDRDGARHGVSWVEKRHNGKAVMGQSPEPEHLSPALKSTAASAFLRNLHGINSQVLDVTGYTHLEGRMDFKCHLQVTGDTDFHADGLPGFRGFCALEHGNPVFPDEAQARAAGFQFRYDANGMYATNPSVIHLIEAGVPVYTPPLRTLTFFRGLGLGQLGPTAWHAAYEIDGAKKATLRPCAITNFAP